MPGDLFQPPKALIRTGRETLRSQTKWAQPPCPRNRIVGEVEWAASNRTASPQDVSDAAMKRYEEAVFPGPRGWKKLATQLFLTASTTSQRRRQGGTPYSKVA